MMNFQTNYSGPLFNCNSSSELSVFREADNITNLDPAQQYTDLYRVCAVIINVFIFITGMFGNVLVIVVVVQTRSMHTPTNCYLLSLAIADCSVLLSATLPAIPETFFQIDEWPFGRVMCSFLIFLQYLGVDASSMSMAAFTIERYIAICHPLQSHAMCTVKRAKRITAGIWIFGILYCSPWLGLTELKRERRLTGVVELCRFRLARHQYLAYYMTDLLVFYVAPLVMSAVLYSLIARNLMLTSVAKANGQQNGIGMRNGTKKTTSSRLQVIYPSIVIYILKQAICYSFQFCYFEIYNENNQLS